jgi:hypothetical protein
LCRHEGEKAVTVYDRLTLDLLRRLKAVGGKEIHIVVAQLANEYGIEQRYVETKLAKLHEAKIIRLSAFHESKGVIPLEAWPSQEYFFNYASDGNHKRVLLLQEGDELLEQLTASETSEPQKQPIGFHG